MFNLFSRPQSNLSNSTSDDKPSSIDFDFNASINIKGKGKVWTNVILRLLGGSIVAGGATYGIANILPDANLPPSGDNPTELLEQSNQ